MTRKGAWILALAAGGLAVGLWLGVPHYHQLLARRLVGAAESAAAANKVAEASRLYALALQRDKDDLTLLHSWATFLAKVHDPQLVAVRSRICQLEPASDDALLDYAEASVQFGNGKLALALLLQRTSQPGSRLADGGRYFHLLSLAYFLVGKPNLADAACSEALKREPDNPLYLVDRAQLRIHADEAAMRQDALATLDRFSKEPRERAMALPALLQYAASAPAEPAQLGDWLSGAEACLTPGNDGYTSYLLALRRWRPTEFSEQLALYTKAAALSGESALVAEQWLAAQGLWREALDFRETLPAEQQSAPPSLFLAAEALAESKQWGRLHALLAFPEWKPVEAVRMAWNERLPALESVGGAKHDPSATWQKALSAAGDNPAALSELIRLSAAWGWTGENEQALWAATNTLPLAADALASLTRICLSRKDGLAYLRVLDRQNEVNPDDATIANNLAFMGFLLDQETSKATRLSEDLCRRFPESADYISTNAFGRFKRGDIKGGLQAYSTMDVKSLIGLAPGFTYGLLLAADGSPEAGKYLDGAERWGHFPEEFQLLASARKKVGSPE